MLTPTGVPADQMDKIMLFSMWANTLTQERPQTPLISAGMGKPTFPINHHIVEAELEYWHQFASTTETSEKTVIGYGDPQGDHDPRTIMSQAMSEWYKTEIRNDNILFTVGGAGALRVIFESFNALNPDCTHYRVITPFPHYTLYKDNRHTLHPVNVMNEPGYRLTARALQTSITEALNCAKQDGRQPKVVLLCNPNNPLGTVITEQEWSDIATVLRQHPDLFIVLDESYAEMSFVHRNTPSLLMIAPDLKNRLIVVRSATKAFSAAGERMAILIAFNNALMSLLLTKNISTIGHASRSSQIAYAKAMLQFDKQEHLALVDFYRPKVAYVAERLRLMGASMPDPTYASEGTFYVLGDFSDLIGLELPIDSKRALGKTGLVTTNEDLAYYLLFNDNVMIAPSCYFGMQATTGFMRITCSGDEPELRTLMDRLEARIIASRRAKNALLTHEINALLTSLASKPADLEQYNAFHSRLSSLQITTETSMALKQNNTQLNDLKKSLVLHLNKNNEISQSMAAIKIQSIFRRHNARKIASMHTNAINAEWNAFIDEKVVFGSKSMHSYFLNLSQSERLCFRPWQDYLQKKPLEHSLESEHLESEHLESEHSGMQKDVGLSVRK